MWDGKSGWHNLKQESMHAIYVKVLTPDLAPSVNAVIQMEEAAFYGEIALPDASEKTHSGQGHNPGAKSRMGSIISHNTPIQK
jgi:hypothetical protein